MNPTPGFFSIKSLADFLLENFSEDELRWVGEINEKTDAIGFKFASRSRFLFSISTHAGSMNFEMYDLEISISDASIENGEILFLDDVSKSETLQVIRKVFTGEIA
ncbi:hypothetical protein KDM87_13980 [Undibacterium sp. FT147W]|uniref:Uncharacterized protein n=1 Tax=Undibacterium rivi TaxID=2828729 RepID=A0ABS5H471_9BURK|nr:hypothetical protein [Undibacterium rivi]MBR7793703.1 hypothetical protein [Undibacterium rivi]